MRRQFLQWNWKNFPICWKEYIFRTSEALCFFSVEEMTFHLRQRVELSIIILIIFPDRSTAGLFP